MAEKQHRKIISLTVDTKSASTSLSSLSVKRPELGKSRKSETNVKSSSSSSSSKDNRSSNGSGNSTSSNSATANRRSSTTATTTTTTKRHSDTGRRGSQTSRLDLSNATIRPSDRNLTRQRPESRTSPLSANLDDIPTLTFAVLGADGAGKSAFIRNAFDLKKAPASPVVSSKVSLSGKIYHVRLIALPFEHVDFTTRPTVTWPKYLDASPFPHIDGAFCLYDFADEDTFSHLPQVLGTLTASSVPTTLLARHGDLREEQKQALSLFHDRVRRSFATVTVAEAHGDQLEKRSMLSMLKLVLSSSAPQPTTRSPSAARTHRPHSYEASREQSRGQSRSYSQLPTSKSTQGLLNPGVRHPAIESARERSDAAAEDGEHSDGSLMEIPPARKNHTTRLDTKTAAQQSVRQAGPQTPISSTEDLNADQRRSASQLSGHGVPETPESYYVKSMLRPSSRSAEDNLAFQTFLNMADDEEPLQDFIQVDVDGASRKLSAVLGLRDPPSRQEEGLPFKALVARLLGLPASKQASKFVPAFLCLYRLFATPKQLLAAILEQFMAVEKSEQARFNKVAEMLRYLQVLGQWTAQYPGDFADPTTRAIANTFIQSLAQNREFGPAAHQISNNLGSVVPDEDADWAYADALSSSSSNGTTGGSADDRTEAGALSTVSSTVSTRSSAYSIQPSRYRRTHGGGRDDDDVAPLEKMILNSAKSSQSFLTLAQLSRAREESKSLRARPHVRLCKLQWHQFMDTPTEELAREITRIDWTLYSSIRPRDYVRHVSLSSQKREKRRQDNISQMVRHFNHLAIFVSGMILLRDKPKHRAQALEKFMDLAWKVRQLNNYNSLGAIVAGINGHEIARLAATRELVPAEKLKQFMRLTILMSVSRSHAAYRMAWENSSAERIPFLPLLRQDLTMASTANPTWIGANINWKKFEIMGEAVVSVQRSLEQPYSFARRSAASDLTIKLILETQIIEEPEDSVDPGGELYNRSVQVEPPHSASGAEGRKKFDWLRR